MSGNLLLVVVLTMIVTCLGTMLVRRYALARSVLDLPNERSSHSIPTPRGGGLAIAIAALAAAVVLGAAGELPWSLVLAMGLGGGLVAGIGWVDDHRHVPARWRALAQLVAAGIAVALFGGLDSLRLGAGEVRLGLLGSGLAIVAIIWVVNLYNFMDGIDGIAGIQAVTVGVFGAALAAQAEAPEIVRGSLLIAAAAAGFLVWNWAPAKIFMGDVGSGLLGFLFAVLALASERLGGPPLLTWLILMGVFVFDATATLLRRAARGERWYDAHREHAYQRLVRAGWSHRRVSLGVAGLNLVLAGVALGTLQQPAMTGWGLAGAFLLLLIVYASVERVYGMRSGIPAPAERKAQT